MIITERVTTGSRTYGSSLDIAEKPEATGIKTKPRFKGILLPKRYLVAAELKAEEQHLEWRSERDINEKQLSGESLERLNSQIDLVVGDGLVPALVPQSVDVQEKPGFVIYYPNRPGVQMEEIAETFGGEIGLVRSEIDIMNPFRNGSEKRDDMVHLNRDLDLVRRVPLDWQEFDAEEATTHFTQGSDFAVPDPLLLTKGEGAVAVAMRILGLDRKRSQEDEKRPWGRIYGTGIRFSLDQASWKGYGDPPPVFGTEKKTMLDLTRNIAAAFGHKAT